MSSIVDYFTSESVCAGHPDKICDAISDAIVDAALAADPLSRTGIETVAGANKISLFGEIKTSAQLNFEQIARDKVREHQCRLVFWPGF
jgi:S-adenosylmethionine synthetase